MDITLIIVLVICALAAALAIGYRLSRAPKPEKASPHSTVSDAHQEFKVTPRGTDPEAVAPAAARRVRDHR